MCVCMAIIGNWKMVEFQFHEDSSISKYRAISQRVPFGIELGSFLTLTHERYGGDTASYHTTSYHRDISGFGRDRSPTI